MVRIRDFSYWVLIAICTLCINAVKGTTIAQIGSEELVNKSELVFVGEVIDVRSEMDHRGYIYTFVDFKVDDVIIGANESVTNITLRFTGGTVGDVRLDVGAKIPKMSEKGIYFVEQVAQGLVNPLFGWTQGHFTVDKDGAVIAGNARRVQSIEKETADSRVISQGVARGIITASKPVGTNPQRRASEANIAPMSLDSFKAKILELKN
jgi:hypothetical protein